MPFVMKAAIPVVTVATLAFATAETAHSTPLQPPLVQGAHPGHSRARGHGHHVTGPRARTIDGPIPDDRPGSGPRDIGRRRHTHGAAHVALRPTTRRRSPLRRRRCTGPRHGIYVSPGRPQRFNIPITRVVTKGDFTVED